ncbi:uncharacterized protein N7511_005185 [Penicillium nucicola]|uniref:uncharacterized protein n=1 Tax=Penicillium nucicola TaxID=1850975 RepID=UPI002544DD8D|nr:uncharacterized protein N7511_005185 [Penicillium nucicola]KAJ5761803.1 hypothetical protein N7511_005185 [Penicillium nucicola]
MSEERFPQELQLQGQQIESIEDALEILRGCDKPAAYQLASQLLEKLENYHERVEDAISRLYGYVDEQELRKGQEDHAEFRRRWKEAKRVQERQASTESYTASIKMKAITAWGEQNANAFFEHLGSRTMVELASKFVRSSLSYEDLRLSVNNEVVLRLSSSGRGIRTTKEVIQGDLSKALTRKNTRPLIIEDLRRLGLQLDQDGYCCAHGMGNPLPVTDTGAAVLQEVSEEMDMDEESDYPQEDVEIEHGSDVSSALSDAPSYLEDPDFDADADTGDNDSLATRRTRVVDCGCAIERAAMNRILALPKDATERQKLIALRKLGRGILSETVTIVTEIEICEDHAKRVFDLFGMRSASKNHAALAWRVDFMIKNLNDWDTVIAEHGAWFIQPKNQVPSTDTLSFYRFHHKTRQPLIANFDKDVPWLSFESLYRRMQPSLTDNGQLPTDLFDRMNQQGTVVIPQLFGWLKEDFDGQHPGGILAMANEEIDMYDYHYQPRPHRPRLGWLRDMWYSIIQQVVKQDPAYYACYVFLRPDHAWRLISYPYYAKSTLPGEQTFFRHIDVNLNDLSHSGRGRAILQGSLSLTDEDENNCTELLCGMHPHVQEWWSDVRQRQQTADGPVSRIEPWMWTRDDVAKYHTDWTKEICRAGDVRVSLPTLPHGSTGPATKIRRTILPWFVRIREDHSTLDVPESNTWEELAAAHRDLIPASRTPSGFTSQKYGRIPYPFPAAVRFCPGNLISRCLVGGSRWTEAGVADELDTLFGENEDAAIEYVKSWRSKAQHEYVRLYQTMVDSEKRAFGKDSFFRRKELGLSVDPPLPLDREDIA